MDVGQPNGFTAITGSRYQENNTGRVYLGDWPKRFRLTDTRTDEILAIDTSRNLIGLEVLKGLSQMSIANAAREGTMLKGYISAKKEN